MSRDANRNAHSYYSSRTTEGRKLCELTELLTAFFTHTLLVLVNDRCPVVKSSINHRFLPVNPLSLCLISNTSPSPNRLQRTTLEGQYHRSFCPTI